MFRVQDYIFVLWGERFDSLVATIFVTQLREAGLRVKLVSLARQRTTGTHGMTLVPDLTLEQVLPLANKAIGVIIPCGSLGTPQLLNDPRLEDFFRQAQAKGAKFVMGQTSNFQNSLFPPSSSNNIVIYPDYEDLVGFARQMAILLSNGSQMNLT